MRSADLLYETLLLRPRVSSEALARHWRTASTSGMVPLARFEGAAVWLLRRLTEATAAETAPPGLIEGLARASREVAALNMMVEAEAISVLRRLEPLGVAVILLKGLARRAGVSRWPWASARATMDVDLLLPADDAGRAWNALVAGGYRRASNFNDPHHQHLPTLIGAGPVTVELHTSLTPTLPSAEAWRRSSQGAHELDWQGTRAGIPCATELLWHAVTHAQQHGMAGWRLRFFLDAASILASSDPVDWPVIRARLGAGEVDTLLAERWLSAAAGLAGSPLPAGIASVPPFDVSRSLRWRLAVLRGRNNRGFGGRLLEEGTRVDLGAPPAPLEGPAEAPHKLRRWLGARAARLVYLIWRSLLF